VIFEEQEVLLRRIENGKSKRFNPAAATKRRNAESTPGIFPDQCAEKLESKRRLPEYVADEPANLGLRSQYSIRLYSWAKEHVTAGTKRISLEELRKVLGLMSVKDAAGNVIQEAPLQLWANFRQSLGYCYCGDQREDRLKHFTRIAGAFKTSAGNHVDFYD
jgi:hypothetical protein